jgi:hypothetical protein
MGFAPIGINKIYHPTGEIPVATVAGQLRLDQQCMAWTLIQLGKDAMVDQNVERVERWETVLH